MTKVSLKMEDNSGKLESVRASVKEFEENILSVVVDSRRFLIATDLLCAVLWMGAHLGYWANYTDLSPVSRVELLGLCLMTTSWVLLGGSFILTCYNAVMIFHGVGLENGIMDRTWIMHVAEVYMKDAQRALCWDSGSLMALICHQLLVQFCFSSDNPTCLAVMYVLVLCFAWFILYMWYGYKSRFYSTIGNSITACRNALTKVQDQVNGKANV